MLNEIKPLVVTGDLNVAHHAIDVYDPKKLEGCPGFSKEERESFTTFLESGFVDIWRERNPGRV